MKRNCPTPILLLFILCAGCQEVDERGKDKGRTTLTENEEENIRLVSCSRIVDYPEVREENLCTDDLCIKYLKIWKELFIEKNGLTESFFDKHIVLNYTSINDWMDGSSFTVCYYVKTDWAIAYMCDGFIIKIKADNTLYSPDRPPRGVLLEKADIEGAIERWEFASEISTLALDDTLKFNTMDDALNCLIEEAQVNTLCFSGVYVDKKSGHLSLEASATYNDEFNKCVFATIDLISGNTTVNDGPCYISNQ